MMIGAAEGILVAGLGAVVLYNWAQWRRDCALARRLRAATAQPPAPLPSTPPVSVLVAAWNDAALLTRHLDSIAALCYPALEHVLCAGGTDDTFELAASRRGLILLRQHPGEGKQAALRRCFEAARGNLLFLTDADCILDQQTFERTLTPLLRGEADASSGSMKPLPEQFGRSRWATYRGAADAYAAARAPLIDRGLLGTNAAVTREALVHAGGFSAAVDSGTDYHLAKRLLRTGGRIRHVRESIIASHYPEDARGYARRQRRWLRNVILHGLRFRAYGEVCRALLTCGIGVGMVALPLGAGAAGPAALMLWIVALTHSVVSKVRYMRFARLSGVDCADTGLAWTYATALVVTPAEFVVAALALIDSLIPQRRRVW